MKLRDAEFPGDHVLVRTLFREYAVELGIDLCFQGFEEELASLPGKYAAPSGALLLAGEEGCVALRDVGDGVCELKRLFVRPSARGSGLGNDLALAIVERGRQLGYRHMVLDTLDRLEPAIRLYSRLGFEESEPYYDNPLPGVVYMRKALAEKDDSSFPAASRL